MSNTHYIYVEYALLDSKLKQLLVEKEALREAIVKDMSTNMKKKTETALGKFSIAKAKKYKYPANVVKAEQNLKALQAKAITTGEATYTESESLRFTPMNF